MQAFAKLPDWSGLWETAASKAIANPAGAGGPDWAIPWAGGAVILLSSVDDPLRLATPWKLTFRFTRAMDLDRMIPYDREADRNPIVDGRRVIRPPEAPAEPASSHQGSPRRTTETGEHD